MLKPNSLAMKRPAGTKTADRNNFDRYGRLVFLRSRLLLS
jgi:hypothetical protein